MKRGDHVFSFTAKELRDAARSECDYHKHRLEHWRGRRLDIIAKAKAVGIDITELENSRSVKAVTFPEIEREFNLANQNIAKHRKLADEMNIHSLSYQTQPALQKYELHPDDVMYFRLHGAKREDEAA